MRKSFSESRLGYVDLTNRARVIMQSRDDPPLLHGDVFVLLLFSIHRGVALPRDNRFAPKIEASSRVVGSRGSPRILNYYSLIIEVLSGIKVRFGFHGESQHFFFSERYLYMLFYNRGDLYIFRNKSARLRVSFKSVFNETKLGNLWNSVERRRANENK